MPENAAETLLERVDARLREMDKTRYWLSKEVTDGQRTGVFTDIARKGFLPAEPRLRRIAELLGVSVDWLMGRTDIADPVRSEVSILEETRLDFRGAPRDERGVPLVGTGDCADLEVTDVEGQHISIERSSFLPDYHVQYLIRPPALRGDKNAYAIFCHGSSMEPRFFAGDTVLVQPARPAGPGDFVVVQLNDGESEDVVSVIVKRLVKQTSAFVELEQYNPAATFRIDRRRVTRIHRIVRAEDLLFT